VRAQPAVLLAALAALALPEEPAAARKPLPELELSGVTYSRYAFQGDPANTIHFCDRTSNVGKGDTARRLHNIMVVQGPGISEVVATRDVPKLPGTLHAKKHRHFSHRGCGRGEAKPVNLPLGAYELQICSDRKIKQHHGRKECFIRDKSFFVIKRSWTGTVTGENKATGGGVFGSDTWQVPSVTYTATTASNPGAGQFTYSVNGGSVNHQVSGKDDQGECTGAGGGTLTPSEGELKMDYKAGHYDIFGAVPVGSTVSATITCPNNTVPVQAPVAVRFLTNGVEQGLTNALPFGHTVLSGAFHQIYSGITQYQNTWSLR
jgi:hypothetical protein